MGLQLGHTFVLWRVQDHGEFAQILLGIDWIVLLKICIKKGDRFIDMLL